jgi:hypothetical protein
VSSFRPAVALTICLLAGSAAPAKSQWAYGGTLVPGLSGWHFAMTPDGSGGAFFVSGRAGSFELDMQAQRLTSTGERHPSWPAAGAVVCAALGNQMEPRAIPDGTGGVLIAWLDYRDSSATFPALFIQRLTASGTRAAGWPATGLLVQTDVSDLTGHALVPDGSGGAIVLWLNGSHTNGNFVGAMHARSNGRLDVTWPVGGASLCPTPGYRFGLHAVSDGSGGAIAVWDDGRHGPGQAEDIFAQRVSASGIIPTGWPPSGLPVCETIGAQNSNSMVAADGQSVVIAWCDGRAGNGDIYAQRVNFDGTTAAGWPAGGLRLTTLSTSEYTPLVATDGGSGAYVVWDDMRTGQYDVYATRVLGSGSLDPVWPQDGYGVCTAATFQYPMSTSDDRGGLYVCWKDHLDNGTYADLYATHVGADAQPVGGWPIGGAQVAPVMDETDLPVIAADGTGAAILAWHGFNEGIRVLKLGPRGVLNVSDRVVPDPALALSAPRPNPARSALTFRLELAGGSRARLELYDVAGRRVANRDLGELGAGAHVVSLQLPERPSPGIYHARLVQGERAITVRAGVIR